MNVLQTERTDQQTDTTFYGHVLARAQFKETIQHTCKDRQISSTIHIGVRMRKSESLGTKIELDKNKITVL